MASDVKLFWTILICRVWLARNAKKQGGNSVSVEEVMKLFNKDLCIEMFNSEKYGARTSENYD